MKVTKKSLIIVIVIAVVVIAATFLAGFEIGKRSVAARGGFRTGAFQGQNMRGGAPAGARDTRFGGAGGMAVGEITAKDDKSITLKLRDGGSRIIFLSSTTEISKFAAGSANDLTVGQSVMVSGTANSDGSVTAKTVQLRPANAPGTPATSAEQKLQ